MNCEHCGKEMYNTPVDGWFHKREQDAIDCFWWQKLTDKNWWKHKNGKYSCFSNTNAEPPTDQRSAQPK